VRQKPRANPAPGGAPGGMTDAAWLQGYALLAPLGLHYELQTPFWHLHEAVRVATDFPDTRIVINHAGMPSDRSEEGLRAWRTALAAVAAQPNVAIKISGIGEAGYRWRPDANRHIVREVIELFGVDRCMFGSNYPVDSLCAPFQSIFENFATYVADFSAQERAQLFVENARRIYRIPAQRIEQQQG
jgi:predicted TIM-barrel fold metal-dependent hydrolase